MGRWRPPGPKSSPYITRGGYERLCKELKAHWPRRREVVAALAAAAAEGDRSENAEYIYRKKQLAGIDRRIRYLERRLPSLTVIDRQPDGETVRFGAWVNLAGDNGDLEYRIVGSDELDHAGGNISVDAPLAKALIGKRVGDVVSTSADAASEELKVIEIRYTNA